MKEKISQPGIIIIDKPAGISSAKAIHQVKVKLNIKKIGHGGTLDPGATGLLICLINGATRLASFVEHGKKTYTGLIRLGVTTSSDDMDGEVLSTSTEIPEFSKVVSVAKKFTGLISQVPPAVSAVKINGERAYKKARRGEEVIIQPREVNVYKLELSPADSSDLIEYKVGCSRGTYIRSLARDLGEILGCGACIETLRRTESYPFKIEQSLSIEDLSLENMLSWDSLFPSSKSLILPAKQVKMLCAGDVRVLKDLPEPEGSNLGIFYEQNRSVPLGLLKLDGDSWKIAANIN